jgi:hypothetical protein
VTIAQPLRYKSNIGYCWQCDASRETFPAQFKSFYKIIDSNETAANLDGKIYSAKGRNEAWQRRRQ